jgi:hypothetical protein
MSAALLCKAKGFAYCGIRLVWRQAKYIIEVGTSLIWHPYIDLAASIPYLLRPAVSCLIACLVIMLQNSSFSVLERGRRAGWELQTCSKDSANSHNIQKPQLVNGSVCRKHIRPTLNKNDQWPAHIEESPNGNIGNASSKCLGFELLPA